tara:strand:+ start:2828 stop:3031 length:204 start_codon:yes stop_codon:yes gene_type:complete
METFLTGLLGPDLGFWLSVATSVIGVFALIATRTKNTHDNMLAKFLLDVVNFLGANVGKAKNDPKAK